jgi:hypothetical protein
MNALEGWQNFYVIVGSAAGALIGLQFVVMTLIANHPSARSADAGAAFGTPTVVHFATVLLLAADVCVPWRGEGLLIVWGALGLLGLLYTALVIRRIVGQDAYQPIFEDWLYHVLLPALAYAGLAASAFVAYSHLRHALFVVGGATLVLLFTAIHNAWDAVTYHIYYKRTPQKEG